MIGNEIRHTEDTEIKRTQRKLKVFYMLYFFNNKLEKKIQ